MFYSDNRVTCSMCRESLAADYDVIQHHVTSQHKFPMHRYLELFYGELEKELQDQKQQQQQQKQQQQQQQQEQETPKGFSEQRREKEKKEQQRKRQQKLQDKRKQQQQQQQQDLHIKKKCEQGQKRQQKSLEEVVIASKKTETWTKNSTPDSRGTSPAASAGRRKRKFPEKYSSYATDECRPKPEVVKERKVSRDSSSSSQTKTATPKPSASAEATTSLDIAAAAAPSTAFKEEIDDDVILLSDSEEEDEEENTVVGFPKMKRIAAAADHPAPSPPKIPILQEKAREETNKVLGGLQLQCPWCGISLESSQELKTHATHDHNKGMGRETKHFYC